MKRITLYLIFSIFLLFPAFASFKGSVVIKQGDTSIPLYDVRVTDGKNVVKTDKKGKFNLPGYEKSRFITITTPAGYTTDNYFIRINHNINSYDFALYISEDSKNAEHSFIQIADTEIHNNGTGIWTSYLREYIKSEKPAFLIHTGDICYESGLKSHIKAVNSKTMGVPVYYGIGNHDLTKGAYGEELYESIYGPTWYSFDIGNTHYIMTPMAGGDHAPSYTKEEVYNWLKNDLKMMKPEQSLIVFNHGILTTDDNFVFGINDKEFINFRDYNLKAWIYGHWHYNYVRNQNGIYTICTGTIDKGGIDHSASAFRVINIDKDGEITTKLRYAFNDANISIISPLDGQESPILTNGKLPISANIYNSNSEVEKITYSLFSKNNIIQSGIITKQLSDWNWADEISIPSTYSNQELELNITAKFNNGEKASSSNSFIYDPTRKSNIKEGGSWNTLLGDAEHTGANTATLSKSLQLEWVNNVQANIFMTSPVITGSKVFIASTDDNVTPNTSVSCFDLLTGKLKWKYRTRNSVKNTIAVSSDILFAQDVEGYLYALDTNSGELKWEKRIDLGGFPYLVEGLTIRDRIIYAGTGKGLSAYDVASGELIWKNSDWNKNEAATTTLTIADKVIVSGSQWGALYGNDLNNGKLLWKLSEDGLSNRGASPTYQDGKLYIISQNSLFIIDPKNGNILTKKELAFNLDVTSTPLITENEIIFGSAGKGLVAIDKETFAIKWNLQTKPSRIYTAPYTTTPFASVETSPVLVENNIYLGASDGFLYVIDCTSGIIQQRIDIGSPILNSVAVTGNTLIVSDYSGNVYAFSSKNK